MIKKVDLVSYLPPFMQAYKELTAALKSENEEFMIIWDAVHHVLYNHFISTADEYGISRYEKMLGIVPSATLTLDERKFTILSKINPQLPFTITKLKEQLKALCGESGYSVILDSNTYTLYVKVELIAKNNYDDVAALLERIVPVNMIVVLSLKYNQYATLSAYSHEYLKQFTYSQLRNEVLDNGK